MSSGTTPEHIRSEIIVEGEVQDVGLRDHIEVLGEYYSLEGYVRNNGNVVQIIADGPQHDVDEFIQEVEGADEDTLANITAVILDEISRNFKIPDTFRKLSPEDPDDIGSTLDDGIDYLSSIDERQEEMTETQQGMAENLSSIDEKQERMAENLSSIDEGQGEIASLLSEIKGTLSNDSD